MFFHQSHQFLEPNTNHAHLTGFVSANDHLHQTPTQPQPQQPQPQQPPPPQQQQQPHFYQQGMEQTSWMVSMAYPHYYHDDPAAFAYFQQELLSPRLQAAMLKQQQQRHVQYQHQLDPPRRAPQQDAYRPPPPPQPQPQPQQHLPSIMVPPQSPTLASYYYEGSNGWVNHYYDSNRHYLSPRAQFDLQLHPPSEDPPYDPLLQQQMMYPQRHHTYQQEPMLQYPYIPPNMLSSSSLSHHAIPPSASPRTMATNQLNHLMSSIVASSSTLTPASTTPSNQTLVLHPYASAEYREEWRENILQYAHTLYSQSPQNPLLLTVLHSLHDTFPRHLPTLLLLACVYYTHQDYQQSLRYNHLILKYDPHYVEAMSNIGTTLRSLGRTGEAERWWYQAVQLRPGYWDAVENLVGVLCSSEKTNATNDPPLDNEKKGDTPPRYKEALQVCEYVETHFFKTASNGPIQLPVELPVHQLPRLQNLFYAKGNLKYALGDVLGARMEYEKGLDLVFGGMGWGAVVYHLALTCCPTANGTQVPLILLQPDQAIRISQLAFASTGGVLPGLATNQSSKQKSDHKNTNTNQASSANIIQQSNQTTSTIMLTLAKLFQDIMNPSTPALVAAAHRLTQREQQQQQGAYYPHMPTLALLLPLYYLSLALHPSPSTANNLGIILSNLPMALTTSAIRLTPTTTPPSTTGLPTVPPLSGTMLAMQYYMYGLQLDPRHPHLYTNLGSLLKDMGHLNEAVAMYEKAVEYNPQFDVALANLGNAIKDMGRVQDSIQWYRRAVQANPDFVDAICGLINALGGVCDWRGRGYVFMLPPASRKNDSTWARWMNKKQWAIMTMGGGGTLGELEPGMVNDYGQWIPLSLSLHYNQGWMGKLVEIVEQQLDQGAAWGQGLIRQQHAHSATHVLDGLIQRMINVLKAASSSVMDDQATIWQQRLAYYLKDDDDETPTDRNEGGWIVRMVERLTRRLQRQWYVDTFGTTLTQPRVLYAPIRHVTAEQSQTFARPLLTFGNNQGGNTMLAATPPVPTVLPFHTFTYPLTARQVRLISHRNALRITQSTLTASWLPSHVYPPPPPPQPRLKLGYVSSDFNNHPLSHLMQSVFGFHDRTHYDVYCYATTPSDQSPYRQKIEQETEHFLDVSQWSNQQVIDRILHDGIHVLVNLNGYTKGARNEIFAARPCPVQCSFMGFAGTLGGGWTDYIIADPIVCPPSTVSCEQWRLQQPNGGDLEGDVDPESQRQDVVYTEKFIYMPHSYFVNDHKQGFREPADEKRLDDDDSGSMVTQHPHGTPTAMLANMTVSAEKTLATLSASTSTTSHSSSASNTPRSSTTSSPSPSPSASTSKAALWETEERKRMTMRRELFPDLPDNVVIFANFNQLYKLEPATFRLWLRILARVPNSILWLLRFPPAGEHHLRQWANDWSGLGQRVVFTDVAPKHVHIHRGRVADIFLDTPECNAHTTAADILWSGTPMVTWPKYEHKMCSRVGASIAYATGYGDDMVVHDEKSYEDKAVAWAQSVQYTYQAGTKRGHGQVIELRRALFLSRESSRLFDTLRWTRHLEQGYKEAWRRWVLGYEFEDYLPVLTGMADHDQTQLATSGCIWIQDHDDD